MIPTGHPDRMFCESMLLAKEELSKHCVLACGESTNGVGGGKRFSETPV